MDAVVGVPKAPAGGAITATLMTAQLESPTVVDRALVSLTDSNKARGDWLFRELEGAAARGERERAAQYAYELGELSERRLDSEERALAAYRRALDLDPAYAPNRWSLRRLLYRRSLWPDLERLIDTELKRITDDAERVDLLYERALVSVRRKGGDPEARTALVGASQLAPHHQGVLLDLERVIARSRDEAQLVGVWERLAEAIDQPERKVAYLLQVARTAAATDLPRASRAFDWATQLAIGISTGLAARVTREALLCADLYGAPAEVTVALDTYAQTLSALIAEQGNDRRTAAYAHMKDLAEVRRRQARLVRRENPTGAWATLQEAFSLAPDDPVLLADLLELAAELGRYKELLVLVGSWRTAETDVGRARMIAAWCAEARLSAERRLQSRALLGAVKVTVPGFVLLTGAMESSALADPVQPAELADTYLEAARAAADGTWRGPGADPQPDPSAAVSFYVQAADVLAYYVGTPEACEHARDALERALALKPKDPAASEALIELDDVTGRPKRALERCREITAAGAGHRASLERALRVAVGHNLTDAVLDLQREIVGLDPADCWAGWQLDATLAQQGLEAERGGVLGAIAKYESDPARRRTALVGVARQHERSGNIEGALIVYRELLPMCPQDAYVRDAYSDLLRTLERWDALVTQCLEAARAATDGGAVRRAFREAAWVLEVRLANLPRAAEIYDEWLTHLPDDRTALEGVARCRAALEDPAGEVVARAAISELDKTAEARWLYARSLERAGRYADASEEYKALLSHEESTVAVATAALALGDLASGSAGIGTRIEALESLAKRTCDTQLSASLHELGGWFHLIGASDADRANDAFAASLGMQADRRGAQLGATLTAARRDDRSARAAGLASLASAMPTPRAETAMWLRSSAAAAAGSDGSAAYERVEAALRATPDDLYAVVVVAESGQSKRDATNDPFAAVDNAVARADVIARRGALVDDPAERTSWELERADALEQSRQFRDASMLLADILDTDPTNRRAVASVRRIARRAGDHELLAKASYVLSKQSRDKTVRLRLLREAAAFHDRPDLPQHAAHARAIYRQIVDLDPAAREGERLAEMLRDCGDLASLVNLLTDQLAHIAAGPASKEHEMVPLLVERATVLQSLGHIEHARADLVAVLEYVPSHVEALRLHGELTRPIVKEPEAVPVPAPLPAPLPASVADAPSARVTGTQTAMATDVRAFEDEHGAWELELTDPEAPKPASLDMPPPRKTGSVRTSNIMRRVVTEERPAIIDPALDEALKADTVVGASHDPFGGQTARADQSDLLEEERRLASAAAKLEADSVVAVAKIEADSGVVATPAPAPAQPDTTASDAPRLPTHTEARPPTQTETRLDPPTHAGLTAQVARAKSVTSAPTFAEPAAKSSGTFAMEQKSMVTVAESPKKRQISTGKSSANVRSLFPPDVQRQIGQPLSEPTLDARQLRAPERDIGVQESAAVLLSMDQLMPASSTEAVDETLRQLEREIAALADDPAAVLVRIEAGRLAEVAGENDRARGHYEAALAADARCRPAMRGLRRLARERGDLAEALAQLDRELQVAGPRELEPLGRYRLDLLLASGNRELAHAATRELLQRDPDDVAALFASLELAVAEDRVEETAAALERLAAAATGELRGALQAARGVLAIRHADRATSSTWFRAAAESDPASPVLQLQTIRDATARGTGNAGVALLELAYKVEREDPIMAAALAIRSQSWSSTSEERETFIDAAKLAAGAAPRDPLVGRIAAETALVTEEAVQASLAFARWVRCKSVPAERAYAAARAAELDPGKLGRLWSQVLELDSGDDYAAARLRAVYVAAGANDQVLELDREIARTANRDVPLLRATAALARERRFDDALVLLETTREYRPSWALVEALADTYGAAKKWNERARILGELAAEPGLLASDVVRLRAAFAFDRAARSVASSTEEREQQVVAALEAWNRVIADDNRSVVAHGAAIAAAGRIEDPGILVKVLARARGAERAPWGASSLSLRYGRMLLANNPRLAQTVAREAAVSLDDPRATMARVMAAARIKDLTEAAVALEERAIQREAKSTEPTNEPTMLRLRACCIALDLGDLPRARQLLARIEKAVPGLVDDLMEIVRLRLGEPAPTMPKVRAGLDTFAHLVREADNASARGDRQLALQYYQRAASLRPDDPFAVAPFVRAALALRANVPLGTFAREKLRLGKERQDPIATADAHELIARVDTMRGDAPAHCASLEAAVAADPTRLDLMVQVAAELAMTGQFGKLYANRSAELARLDADPQATERDRVALLLDAANLATLDKRSDEIVAAHYHAVLALDSRNRRALFHLDAFVHTARALEAQVAIEDHIASAHDDPRIRATFLTRAGETLADQGKRAEAIQRFVAAIDLVPDHRPALDAWYDTALAGELWPELAEAATRKAALSSTPEEAAALHYFAGVVLMDRALARPAAAIALQRALAISAGSIDALLRLRMLLERTPQFEEYAVHVRRRLEDERDVRARIELHRMLAELACSISRVDEAILQYRSMLAIDPGDARAHAAIADVSTDPRDPGRAIDAVKARMPLERDVLALRTLNIRLGNMLLSSSPVEALQAYQRAVTYAPDDEEALVRTTDLAIELRQWDVATNGCDRLVNTEREPAKLSAHLQRAALIFLRGFDDRERAERMLRLAIDSSPTSVELVQRVVQFYTEANDVAALHAQLQHMSALMRSRIEADVTDGAAYRMLCRLALQKQGASPPSLHVARAAAELARLVGAAGDIEQRVLAEEPPLDLARIASPAADERLFAGASAPQMRELFRRFAAPLAKIVGVDVAVYGVGRKERLAASHPIQNTVKPIAMALGFKQIEIYVSTKQPFVMACEPTSPPSLVLGASIVNAGVDAIRFAAGAALKLAQLSLSLPARLPLAEIGSLAQALVKVVNPDVPVVIDDASVGVYMQKLRRHVSGNPAFESKASLPSMSSTMPQLFVRDLKILGLRAGLAASDSIGTGLAMLAGIVGTNVQAMMIDPIGRDLVVFALRDP